MSVLCVHSSEAWNGNFRLFQMQHCWCLQMTSMFSHFFFFVINSLGKGGGGNMESGNVMLCEQTIKKFI